MVHLQALGSIVVGFKVLFSDFASFKISFSCNVVAHKLAKHALSLSDFPFISTDVEHKVLL